MTVAARKPVTTSAADATPAPHTEWATDHRVVLEGISWDTYLQILREIGDAHVRLTFDAGRLEIMSPGGLHEDVKTVAARVLEMYSFLAGIPVEGYGSWTLKTDKLQKALEPDECYYITSVPAIAGKKNLDLAVDPPPDLAIEVDISRPRVGRQPIYAALRIPEVWRYDGRRFLVLRRNDAGQYAELAASVELPGLPLEEFNRFVQIGLTSSQTAAVAALAEWFRSGAGGKTGSETGIESG